MSPMRQWFAIDVDTTGCSMDTNRTFNAVFLIVCWPFSASASDCVQGQWDIANFQYQRDGSVTESRALSDRHCLAGRVIADEFRSLDAEGRVNFRGVSFQIQRGSDVSILWAMVGDPGYTSITGRFGDDGSLTTTGVGEDLLGNFEERFVMVFHEDGLSYDMEMGRKYAQLGVWIQPFNRLEATYSSSDTRSLQTKPVAWIAEAANDVHAAAQHVILDGWALASVSGNAGDITIRFSSRYTDPDRWRTLSWSESTGAVTASEITLGDDE